MISVFGTAPSAEATVAHRLRDEIRRAWPDLEAHPSDRATIIVGLETLREIDLLVTLEFGRPRPVRAVQRRAGSASSATEVQAAAIVIELKQLDASRFTIVGPEIFPDYAQATRHRSVNQQVRDAVLGLRQYRDRYDMERFYIHGVGWLTEVPSAELKGVSPWIVGAEAGWFDLLDAAAQQGPALYEHHTGAYVAAIATLRETLTRVRPVSPCDRRRADDLARDTVAREIVDDVERHVGSKFVRFQGRGGSGKTTALVLLAKRLAETRGERVLILTFHRTLRGDIAHLVDSLSDNLSVTRRNVAVETMFGFFTSVLVDLGLASASEPSAFDQLDARLVEANEVLDEADIVALKSRNPGRFAFDTVLVDEAQDWSDAERDFLRRLYKSESLVIADGLEQLIRRQTPCHWTSGLTREERIDRWLGRSLRMTRNVALFANAVAKAAGLRDWRIEPMDKLYGGRIVICEGEPSNHVAVYASLKRLLKHAGAAPVDALTCMPGRSGGVDRVKPLVEALFAAGERVWNGSDPNVRDEPPDGTDSWRFVRYDSSRGLEGWVTLAYALDALYAAKCKHPNLAQGDEDEPEQVARRWLMIPLTRAVGALAITLDDPGSAVAGMLRAASAEMPAGVVEWTTPEHFAARIG